MDSKLIIIIGKYLELPGVDFVSPQELQDEVCAVDFGFRPALDDCRLALNILKEGGFLEETMGLYSISKRAPTENRVIIKAPVTGTYNESHHIGSPKSKLWIGEL